MASGSAAFSNPLENSDFTLPDSIADVRLPQTPLARDAALIMFSAVPRPIFNHCLRTFVLGMKDAQRRGLDVDTESAFHASILHDLCLAPTYPGSADKTFEENSADFAAAFARAAGLSDRRAENIYLAIILHAGQATGRGADIEFVMHGARQDVIGPTHEELSDEQVHEIEETIPRLGFRMEFISILEDHLTRTRQPGWTAGFTADPPERFLMNRWSS